MSQRQKPRRTNELLDPHPVQDSTSRQSRISRIAQPIRPSTSNKRSLDRAVSSERLSTAKTYLSIPTSSSKRQRSVSATPTPQRTPKSKYNLQQNPAILLTVEKPPTYDKKLLQIEANHINDYLRSIENKLGCDFWERGGIKAMSTKQFMIIVQYFIKKCCGNRLTISNVESIPNILTKIQYPYTINKSWLKTPCAPHAFNSVVLLFNWFISFENSKQIEEYEKSFVIAGNIFPDEKYTIKFLKQTRKSFDLWNNNSKNEHLKEELKNDLISKRIDLKSTDEVVQDINSLNLEIDNILGKDEINIDEKKYDKFKNEIQKKETKINSLEKNLDNNEWIINELRLEVEKKQNLIKDTENRIEEIRKVISKQKLSATERNEFIKELSQLNLDLQTKEKGIFDLKDICNKKQIIISRLIRKKNDLMSKVNKHIYTIFNELDDLKNLNIEEYNIHKDSNDIDIAKITEFFIQTQEKISKNIEYYKDNLKELENQLSILIYTYETILIRKVDTNKNKIIDYETKIKEVDMQLINAEEQYDNMKNVLNTKLNYLKLSTNKKKEQLELKTIELEKRKTENENQWSKLESKLEKMFDYKEQKIEKINDLVNDFNKTIDEVRLSLKDIL